MTHPGPRYPSFYENLEWLAKRIETHFRLIDFVSNSDKCACEFSTTHISMPIFFFPTFQRLGIVSKAQASLMDMNQDARDQNVK